MPRAVKPKIGRPATGRDPVVSIRLPARMVESVNSIAKYNKVAAAEVYREAMTTGLRYMRREPLSRFAQSQLLRPKHFAEIHEAGHAVALFLQADALGCGAHECVHEVRLKRRGGGYVQHGGSLPPKVHLRILVAGAVAQAIDEHKPFAEVWNGPGCSGDRKRAEQIIHEHKHLSVKRAANWVYDRFEDSGIWDALDTLARRLIMNGVVSGDECWEIFSDRLADIEAHVRVVSGKYFGPIDDACTDRLND